MNRGSITVLLMILGLCLFAPVLQAQEMDGLEESLGDVSSKKKPSVMHRAEKDNPREQLAWAQSLLKQGQMREARKQFLALVHQWHNSAEASAAQMAYAEQLAKQGKHDRAFKEFQYLIDNFAGDFSYEKALDHQFRIANHVMTVRRFTLGFLPGFLAPERALPLFETIVENAPNWEKAPRAQFSIGLINEQMKDYEKAINAYEIVQQRYKKSSFAAESSFRKASCLYSMAKASPRDEKICRTALSALAVFLRDFPHSAKAETAASHRDELKKTLADMYYDRAIFYDRKVKRPKAAIIAYSDFIKKFPGSEMIDRARERVKILKTQLEDVDE